MNKIQNVLRSYQLLRICKFCTQDVLNRIRIGQIRHFSSLYKPRYDSQEQKQILQKLNESSAEELSRFAVSKGRINSLQQFRRKRGQFRTLDEVLEVDGLGVKVLEKLCDSILNQISGSESYMEESQILKQPKPSKKSKSQLLTPTLRFDQIKAVTSAVGIYIGVNVVTWAHIDYSGKLLHWDLYNLEFGSKKLHLTSLFEVVRSVCEKLPAGDLLYIMEDKGWPMQSQQQPASVFINLQNCQLTAMFVALLNNFPLSLEESPQEHEHRVFFLRFKLPARLFGIMVGTERVSAQTVVLDILTEPVSRNSTANKYTPISVSKDLTDDYLNRTSVEKENLCCALLLTMTFMDLIVHKNPQSLKLIQGGKS